LSARQEILTKLKRQLLDQVPLPDSLSGEWQHFEDPLQRFAEMIAMVGGSCTRVQSVSEISAQLATFEEWRSAQRIFSAISAIPGTVDLEAVDDPHTLENLDFVIYPGEFAVAENGAIWLTDRDLRHRVVFFITQYLALVVHSRDIVATMHDAYARAHVPQPGFGLFLSGPSKTADIEQSLVIGAHGCRELQVYVLES
jgi:L-lactate dehydrogenase complex protein LldG